MDIERCIYERDKVRETLATPGARIIAQKLQIIAKESLKKEMKADPFTEPGEIIKARQLRYVIKSLLPRIVEGMMNYDPEAIDRQAAGKERITILEWLKQAGKVLKHGINV